MNKESFLLEDGNEQQYIAEVSQWWRDPEYEAWLDSLEAQLGEIDGELED